MSEAKQAEPETIESLNDWVVNQGLGAADLAALIEVTCRRVEALGLPLLRMHVAMSTLHPTYEGFGGSWWRHKGFEQEHYEHGGEEREVWRQSPLRAMIDRDLPRMRRRLQGPDAQVDFPVLREFRDQGGTDWYAHLVRFGGGQDSVGLPGMVVSWVSDQAGGFKQNQLDVIDRLVPCLALACFRIALQQVAENLLHAYVGADAGRRILAGQVERGAVTRLSAVILFADLRGFTSLADEASGDAVLACLNDHLGNLADTIESQGGQVLKYLGDGLIGVFALENEEADQVCARALEAASSALAGNDALCRKRQAAGEPSLALDVALHLGELMYGNVGSGSRLDFTTIGPAVNEASRIEALCEPLGENLLISQSFAEAQDLKLRSLGSHHLRGVTKSQELFALP